MDIICNVCESNFKVSASHAHLPLQCSKCFHITRASSSRGRRGIGLHPVLAEKYREILTDDDMSPPNKNTFAARPIYRGTEEPPPQDKQLTNPPEFSIPGYDVLDCIGQGAMGAVYRAHRCVDGREVAIKVLAEQMALMPELVSRFEREAAALRSFRHDNVVAIFDSGFHTGVHYLCMEFISGTTLRRVLRAHPPSVKTAIYYVRSILAGLDAAHKRGVIHRDLKPENVLVQAPLSPCLDGLERVVVVDFGLAGIVNESMNPHPNLTKSRMTMGTINYMAPEQNIDAKRVDQRSDIYSCGVILYECLAGDLPVGRYLLPSERGIAVPASVDRCILKALSTHPGDRFNSAKEFDEILAGIEIELRKFSSVTPVMTSVDVKILPDVLSRAESEFKNKNILFGLAILFVGIVFGILFIYA